MAYRVERDMKAFGITGDWRQQVTQALEWYKAVTEGAQRLWTDGGRTKQTRRKAVGERGRRRKPI